MSLNLSEECDVECLTLKSIMTTYFKRLTLHENRGKCFFCPMDKKINFLNIEWCTGKCPRLCTIFFKTSTL